MNLPEALEIAIDQLGRRALSHEKLTPDSPRAAVLRSAIGVLEVHLDNMIALAQAGFDELGELSDDEEAA